MTATTSRSATPVKRKRTRPDDDHSDSFKLLLARFDRVDKDNEDIKKMVTDHIEKAFTPMKQKVDQQSVYWGLLLGLGTPAVLTVIVAYVQGWLR